MVTVLNFKPVIDLPKWRSLAPSVTEQIDKDGTFIFNDMRNNDDRHPLIYQLNSTSSELGQYNTKTDNWIITSMTAFSDFGKGSNGIFMPSRGPRGTINPFGITSSKFTISAPPAILQNALANRGDGRGYKIRIIGNSAIIPSSGKTEERIITSNTLGFGSTKITLDSALSFIPQPLDSYEILSGKIYAIIGSTATAPGAWTEFDITTETATNLSVVNLPATLLGPTNLIGLDELHVPYDRNPGEGFFGILTAQATTNGVLPGTLTGQAIGGDANVLANEYTNFQIRIIEDTVNTTAAGQRQRIASHTAGPSPVYTLYNPWTVQPSNNCKYVIENDSDKILMWTNGAANTNTYSISTDTWDVNTTFVALSNVISNSTGGAQSFGIELDAQKLVRHSFIFLPSSGGVVNILDIAGSPTGTSTSYTPFGLALLDTSSSTHDPATLEGKYLYINTSNGQRFYRFNMKDWRIEPVTYLKVPPPNLISTQGGTKVATELFIDGDTKLTFLVYQQLQSNLFFGLDLNN